MVEQTDTSRVSIHLVNSSGPSLIHLMVPLLDFLVMALTFVDGVSFLLSQYVPHARTFNNRSSLKSFGLV